MYFVTNGYETKEFKTKKEANTFIQEDVNKHNLRAQEIFNYSNGYLRVIVYQYYTLYTEVYIVHKRRDMKRPDFPPESSWTKQHDGWYDKAREIAYELGEWLKDNPPKNTEHTNPQEYGQELIYKKLKEII